MDSLRDKIIELFEYRRLPWMLGHTGLSMGERDGLYQKLIDLQADIFRYDQVLEENWDPVQGDLDKYWKKMKSHLRALGYNQADTEELLEEIAIYAANELNMREGEWLSDIDIWDFYYYKSCDVRLMRKLILRYIPGGALPAGDPLLVWRIFDYVTEVNDDLSDLEEDAGTYNGNRFLQCLSMKGPKSTYEQYRNFLSHCINALENHGNNDPLSVLINSWAAAEARTTMVLLSQIESSPEGNKIVRMAAINEQIN